MTWQDERVRSIRKVRVRTRYPRIIGRNARLPSHGSGPTSTLLIVESTGGAIGQGIIEHERTPLPDLTGRRLGELFASEYGILDEAFAPFDIALHDLVARLLDVGVHRVLGCQGDRTIRCYSGAIYLDDLDPEDAPRGIAAVLENCAADHAAGFRDFKLKIGRGNRWMEQRTGLRRDIEVTRAVRAAYPEARLMVDANDGYPVDRFLEYLREVADCLLFWVEEPFQENETDLLRLRSYLRENNAGIRIADGEHRPEMPKLLRLAERGLIDVLLMDVVSHGFTPWRRTMPILHDLGVQASPHAWGLPLKTLYAAQLAAGLGNVPTVEGVPGDTEGVGVTSYGLTDGLITVPERAGFGVDPVGLPAGGGT